MDDFDRRDLKYRPAGRAIISVNAAPVTITLMDSCRQATQRDQTPMAVSFSDTTP